MQDRYAGDIGDYVKLAFLRQLEEANACKALGVAWYRVPNEDGKEDGRYIRYLSEPDYWQEFCPETFTALARVVCEERSVARLQATGLLKTTCFHGVPLNARDSRKGSRGAARDEWFSSVKEAVRDCDLVFVDPDNGIAAGGFDVEDHRSHKSIAMGELVSLGEGSRGLVIYHHQTRSAGGHLVEVDRLHEQLRGTGLIPAGSLRARPWSPRLFILINASGDQVAIAKRFAERWVGEVDWFPAGESAASRTLQMRERRSRA